MAGGRPPVTVGVDIGTTSVKAVSVDDEGKVLARARISHGLFHPDPDLIEHDARKAWRQGPTRALAAVARDSEVQGVCVAGMVPSMTAVSARGVPMLPGILYEDARSRDPGEARAVATMGLLGSRAAETMLRWAHREAPEARGYWPAQAVATHSLGGPASVDGTVAISMGTLLSMGSWDAALLESIGVAPSALPVVVDMGVAAGRIPEGKPAAGAALAGGTVDALCDQIVSGAVETGDVLVICGATLVVWAVVDDWIEAPGIWTVPHTAPGKVLVGGASNAGGLFVDWARSLLGRAPHNPAVSRTPSSSRRSSRAIASIGLHPDRVPIWVPYLRGERVPYHDPAKKSSLHRLDVAQDSYALERAAYEATGFVVRHILDRAGVSARRIVASGGGTRSGPWMQAMADSTGLPVDSVAVPEGAALGAAFVARVAAGLEASVDGAGRWASVGRRLEPDPAWAEAASERYGRFVEYSEREQA